MARLATLVREVKRESPNTIFAIGGDFLSRTRRLRTQETNVGDFVADLLRERLGSDGAFISGGAIRTNRTAVTWSCACPLIPRNSQNENRTV